MMCDSCTLRIKIILFGEVRFCRGYLVSSLGIPIILFKLVIVQCHPVVRILHLELRWSIHVAPAAEVSTKVRPSMSERNHVPWIILVSVRLYEACFFERVNAEKISRNKEKMVSLLWRLTRYSPPLLLWPIYLSFSLEGFGLGRSAFPLSLYHIYSMYDTQSNIDIKISWLWRPDKSKTNKEKPQGITYIVVVVVQSCCPGQTN